MKNKFFFQEHFKNVATMSLITLKAGTNLCISPSQLCKVEAGTTTRNLTLNAGTNLCSSISVRITLKAGTNLAILPSQLCSVEAGAMTRNGPHARCCFIITSLSTYVSRMFRQSVTVQQRWRVCVGC